MEKETKQTNAKKNKRIVDVESVNELKKEPKNIKEKVTKKCDSLSYKRHSVLTAIIVTTVLCMLFFYIFYLLVLNKPAVETARYNKNVTITDTGLADAVDKVYDAVVVVETFVNKQSYGSGTGFVYLSDNKYGYILTNYHVIANSTSVRVTFTNQKQAEAKIVGSDEYSDIAVLRVDKDNIISIAETGNVDSMRVGDTTFAVGAPLDSSIYSWSVTRGILSGKNRMVEIDSSSIMEVLQTDTAINAGNSGGPLCNANGEVIGITNMKLASSNIEGMGFAIPIDTALEYAKSIVDGRVISRPYLGVAIYDASSYFFSDNTGIYIESVESKSAAAKAGLQRGDKILKVNGKEVSNTAYFKYELYKYKVGDKITITIERNEKSKDIKVVLGSTSKAS